MNHKYTCTKCGKECYHWSAFEKEPYVCSKCRSNTSNPIEQKEPFNFEHPEHISLDAFGSMDEVPDDVRKVEPKHVPSITDLIRDEAKKRAMRNECNGIYKRSADVDVPACAICAGEMEAGYTLKTATGHVICASCHSKLYDTVETKPLQSYIEERYDAIPQESLRAIARVMGFGTRKYGENNWDKISTKDHVNHALRHINLALLGDVDDEDGFKAHLSHALCRLMFAYETYKEDSE